MIIGDTFDLRADSETVYITDKVLGEKFTIPLVTFEDYIEDLVGFIADKA